VGVAHVEEHGGGEDEEAEGEGDPGEGPPGRQEEQVREALGRAGAVGRDDQRGGEEPDRDERDREGHAKAQPVEHDRAGGEREGQGQARVVGLGHHEGLREGREEARGGVGPPQDRQGDGRAHHPPAAHEVLRQAPQDERARGGRLDGARDRAAREARHGQPERVAHVEGHGAHPAGRQDGEAHDDEDLVEAAEQLEGLVALAEVLARAAPGVGEGQEARGLGLGDDARGGGGAQVVAREALGGHGGLRVGIALM
jgi:hypothetical protein